MRRPRLLSLALVGSAAVGFAVMATVSDDDETAQTDAAEPSGKKIELPKEWPRNPDAESMVEQLGQDGGAGARRELASLFSKWAGDEDKVWARRAIVDQLLQGETPKAALKSFLAAVDKSPMKSADDPVYEYAVEKLQEFWAVPAMFDHGRNRLLTARTDTSRALLGRSLAEHAATADGGDVSFNDPDGQRRAWLGSDIVDAHTMTQEPWAKAELQKGMSMTLGDDVAKVLADPLGTKPEELSRLGQQLDGMKQGASDIIDGELEANPQDAAALDRIRKMDQDELIQENEQPRRNPHQSHRPPNH